MLTVNIHDAKTNLSRLIQRAVNGEPFVIAKAGEPLVKVSSIHATGDESQQRIGFMKDEIQVPDDFDQMNAESIQEMFGR